MQRWLNAGLIDAATAEAIRAFESGLAAKERMRWLTVFAWIFGSVLVGAGVLLFVAAHWDALSPAERFALVLALVAVFHVLGAVLGERSEILATLLHGLGTVVLGAGIFLAGQIFNLQEHWPGGLLLWALGAWIGWGLRRDVIQATLVAVLTPAWLSGEWKVATEWYGGGDLILAEGALLLAITYFAGMMAEKADPVRRALMWVGALALIPSTFYALEAHRWGRPDAGPLPLSLIALGWGLAFGLPLGLGAWLRGRAIRMNLLGALWVLVLGTTGGPERVGTLPSYVWSTLGSYFWCGVGSVLLVLWGLQEGRRERINMGMAGFALTVLTFYFSHVMDKLARSTSMISLGLIFLFGGWLLERTRRRLVARVSGGGQ